MDSDKIKILSSCLVSLEPCPYATVKRKISRADDIVQPRFLLSHFILLRSRIPRLGARTWRIAGFYLVAATFRKRAAKRQIFGFPSPPTIVAIIRVHDFLSSW